MTTITRYFRYTVLAVVLFLLSTPSAVFAQQKDDGIDWAHLDDLVEKEFGKIIRNTDEARMVERIGLKLFGWANTKDFHLSFKLIDNEEANAFAFGNGNVYVLKGLFKTISSEDELAFVMAHEISHVIHKHSAKTEEYKEKMGVTEDDDALMKAYSRELEYEADKYGILYAIRAGYSPLGSVNWFNRMTNLGYEYPPLYVNTSDHPNFTQRVVQAFVNIGTYYEYAKNFDYGMLYLSMGHWGEAADAFGTFLEKYPGFKEAYNNIGVSLLAKTITDKEISLDLWLSTAISRVSFFGSNFDQPSRKGAFALKTSDFQDAIENLNKAISYDKSYSEPLVNLALINIFTNDLDKAKRNLDAAFKLNKDSYEGYITLGFMHTQKDDYLQAANAFKKAASLDSKNGQPLYNLALVYQWDDKKDLAKQAWKDFLALVPDGYYADIAKENLTALEKGYKPDVTRKDKKEETKVYSANLAGITLDADMTTVQKTLKSPDNRKVENGKAVWEYVKPNITVGFDENDNVDYVLVFDPIKGGLEYAKNINVGNLARQVTATFGNPEQVLQDGPYQVYNYRSMGLAFWIQGDVVKGIGIYKTE